MAKILRFEDIQIWQSGRELTKQIYRLSGSKKFSTDFALRDQIRRACISITSNIAEGFDARSNPEFIRFLNYSRRSVSEVKNQLYVALDEEYVTPEEFRRLYDDAANISRMILGFIRYLRISNIRRKTDEED